jgi:polar amino acid transport system substrate-binding protein
MVLAGCGSGTAADPSSAGPTATSVVSAAEVSSVAKLVPSSIATAGTLHVGVALGTPPDEFQDANGTLVGWEVDVVRTAAQTMGLKVAFSESPFDSLIPGLQAHRYDLAIGQFGVTGNREKVVDFVTTLSSNELFAAKANSGITVRTLADLCGHSVATSRGSREAGYAQQEDPQCAAAGKKPIDTEVFNDTNSAALALMSGRVELFWLGSTAISYFVRTTHGQAAIVGHYLDSNPLGIALPKNSPLDEALQAAMQHNIDSGVYGKVLGTWGLTKLAIRTSEVNPHVATN